MLAARSRLRSAHEFRRTLRQGVKAARPSLVVHLAPADPRTDTRVGFVVSRAVGSAVARNRVKRRLRHAAAGLVDASPCGLSVVVRALPSAAQERTDLTAELSAAWDAGLTRLARR